MNDPVTPSHRPSAAYRYLFVGLLGLAASALPANAAERQTHILWDGRFYALTFVKAG